MNFRPSKLAKVLTKVLTRSPVSEVFWGVIVVHFLSGNRSPFGWRWTAPRVEFLCETHLHSFVGFVSLSACGGLRGGHLSRHAGQTSCAEKGEQALDRGRPRACALSHLVARGGEDNSWGNVQSLLHQSRDAKALAGGLPAMGLWNFGGEFFRSEER